MMKKSALEYTCLGVTGFLGDKSNQAMKNVNWLNNQFATAFKFEPETIGQMEDVADLPWKQVLKRVDPFIITANRIGQIFERGQFPFVVASRCALAIVTLPEILRHYPDVVIIWLDAHGDLNIPASSDTGYIGGMSLSASLGGWQSGYGAGLLPENLVHIGARDLDAAERLVIADRKICCLDLVDIEKDLRKLKAIITGRSVYIHLDVDVFDPSEVVADYHVEEGLYRQDVAQITQLVKDNATLIGLEVTEMSACNDEEKESSKEALIDAIKPLFC